jgi:hypothetical protein
MKGIHKIKFSQIMLASYYPMIKISTSHEDDQITVLAKGVVELQNECHTHNIYYP